MPVKPTAPAAPPDAQDARAVLAYNIRFLRAQLGWSQEHLASVCGLDRSYVSALERNRWNVSLSNIVKLAAAFETQPWQLLRPPEIS